LRHNPLRLPGRERQPLDQDAGAGRVLPDRGELRPMHDLQLPDDPDAHRLVHGRYGFPFHAWQPLDPKAMVLAQLLREAGYVNQLITDNPHLMWECRKISSSYEDLADPQIRYGP